MFAGLGLLFIASVLRAWGALNHRRPSFERVPIFNNPFVVIAVSVGSTLLGAVGAVLIGLAAGFVFGIIAFVLFWFLSSIWVPFLTRFGF